MPNIELKLKPFPVPYDVMVEFPAGLRQDGMQSLPRISLKDLSDEALEQLLEDFKVSVMKSARPDQK